MRLKKLLGDLVSAWRWRRPSLSVAELLGEADRLEAMGDVGGAIRKCQEAHRIFPNDGAVLIRQGGILARAGRYAEARQVLGIVLATNPNHPDALFALGTVALLEGRLVEAAGLLDQALIMQPDNGALWANRGQVAARMGDADAAIVMLRRALDLVPLLWSAADPLFSLLIQTDAYDDALALADRLIASDSANGRWWRMKGFVLFKRYYRPEEAEMCFTRAESTEGSNAGYWVERGICARDLADTDRALAFFSRALALEPNNPLARFHRGLTYLYIGKYETAWDDYEARFADSTLKHVTLPAQRWMGELLCGKELVLLAEQGLGDEIMFASCFDSLPRDGRVVVTCSEKLLSIYRASFPDIEFVAKDGFAPGNLPSNSRVALAIGSLPALFRRHEADFPRRPYLVAPASAKERAAPLLGQADGRLKVGISWRGGTEASRLRLRTLDMDTIAQLAQVPGIQWFSLQYGDCQEDIRLLEDKYGISICHDTTILADYGSTAALVEGLDLIVTVCTSIVHLAGALGKKVWVLAPKVPEWRYGLYAPYMLWYSDVEVLRQSRQGDWSVLVEEIKRRLSP